MHVSYAEFARSTPEVLRMLGASFGQADDSVEGFLYTHATYGVGYLLVKMTDEARGNDDWLLPRLSVAPDHSNMVDLRNGPLLLFATRICDLVIAKTRPNQQSHTIVSNTFGGWLAPYMAFRLARSGIASLITWSPPPAHVDEEAPFAVLRTSLPRENQPVEVAVCASRPFAEADRASCDKDPRREAACTKVGTLSIAATADHSISQNNSAGGEILVLDELLQAFISEGRDVDATIHRTYFTQIAARIRIETSDRSRQQAG